MTKPKSVCNQQALRFLTAFLVPHPETTESGVSRRWEDVQSICGSVIGHEYAIESVDRLIKNGAPYCDAERCTLVPVPRQTGAANWPRTAALQNRV